MKEKSYEMTILFDYYGDVLTEKQRELFDLYYNEDLSLAEISEHLGITRQGVRDGIVRAEEIITDLENKLGFSAKYGKQNAVVRRIVELAERIQTVNDANFRSLELDECADEIEKLARTLAD